MMTASIFARPILQAPDLVISVDAYVAHLAGALAKPVGLMLSLTSDWRWLQARGDNPWYPMMRRGAAQFKPILNSEQATIHLQILLREGIGWNIRPGSARPSFEDATGYVSGARSPVETSRVSWAYHTSVPTASI